MLSEQRRPFKPYDWSKFDKSRTLTKKNKQYLDLLSVVSKSRYGFEAEHLILHLVQLPFEILLTMESFAHGAERVLRQFAAGKIPVATYGEAVSAEESRKAFEKHFKTTMRHFFAIDSPHSGALSRSWLFAVTLYIWTAFEYLAADLWVGSLNQSTTLAQRILASMSNEVIGTPGLSRRQIDVGLAARYGFDLRHSLGTILKPKFDFSNVDGIEAAYKGAFGGCGEIEQLRDDLRQLEQVRHLIVHRGGVMDDKFLKLSGLKGKKGANLTLTLPQVTDFMVTVALSGMSLLKIVDEAFDS
jgi:hypothetical protein